MMMHDRRLGMGRRWVWGLLLAVLVLFPLYSLWTFSNNPSVVEGVAVNEGRFRWPHDVEGEQKLPSAAPSESDQPFNALEELHYALETMQNEYFQIWLGKWPTSIDWTGAVMGTFMSASLYSLTRSLDYVLPPTTQQPPQATVEGEKVENEINRYFSQSIAYYFGENAFAIRLQAFDDMLWVVLGWLEGIRFVQLHSDAHYPITSAQELGGSKPWYGNQFVPSFAHRANIFYEIASHGWDTKLCGGGMVWNPHLTPYKNAITNELYISASIGMYLYFPGDRNDSPFLQSEATEAQAQLQDEEEDASWTTITSLRKPHDPLFLYNAIEAYDWLKNSNMTNEKGLYVDGFHIKGWNRNGSIGTGKCDERNEMVYTYNQGVLLSGLRSLWEATGNLTYLEDGHKLVRSVIAATGWRSPTERTRWWSGLGRNGILEELCDASGTCSQDGQTFKGIFFHHFTSFCEPLPQHTPLLPGKTHVADPVTYSLHAQSCKEYATWVVWNARAAMRTRDDHGRFGMWWGVPHWADGDTPEEVIPDGAEDYRNRGLGSEERWGAGWREDLGNLPPNPGNGVWPTPEELSIVEDIIDSASASHPDLRKRSFEDSTFSAPVDLGTKADLNDRGRGRTLETQGGGVAVLRAMWEFVHMYAI